ncbi:MAG TPA: Gfo/Idh/MocA family oxidoreductase [Tepidisphaeraceae bacterium]|jgi:predicted dehydrogenase|nr:Gfo/Idh/MocA family oxidoreductase [Tepidisphaeraceae bacterium]
MKTIDVGIIGSGRIALANHLPGLALCPEAKVVALCDSNPTTLEEASRETGVTRTYSDYRQLLGDENVNAVIVATPNFLHAPISIAACEAGKHVLCEKPIAMNLTEAKQMLAAAEKAHVRHMTAFTYRFVPAIRYMAHLIGQGDVGQPYHFRADRFQDWGDRDLGWRQIQKFAATGELGDMLSHRIDYAHLFVGPMRRLVAHLKKFVEMRGHARSELDDWVAMICDFENDATGVLESSKLATGRGEGAKSLDSCEVNGSEGTVVYHSDKPFEVLVGRKGGTTLEHVGVPREFLTWPGSPRDPFATDPVIGFRYDQDVEFIRAILENRPCRPSFAESVDVQRVMDAALISESEKRWVELSELK